VRTVGRSIGVPYAVQGPALDQRPLTNWRARRSSATLSLMTTPRWWPGCARGVVVLLGKLNMVSLLLGIACTILTHTPQSVGSAPQTLAPPAVALGSDRCLSVCHLRSVKTPGVPFVTLPITVAGRHPAHLGLVSRYGMLGPAGPWTVGGPIRDVEDCALTLQPLRPRPAGSLYRTKGGTGLTVPGSLATSRAGVLG